MTKIPTLYNLDRQYDELMGLAEGEEIDEQTLADTLEGLAGTMVEKRLTIGDYMQNLKDQAKLIKESEARMAERRKRYERRHEWLTHYLMENMRKHGITLVECPEWSVTLRQNPERAVIKEGTTVPLKWCRVVPEQYEPDKKVLKEALKKGATIEGVTLERTWRLEWK